MRARFASSTPWASRRSSSGRTGRTASSRGETYRLERDEEARLAALPPPPPPPPPRGVPQLTAIDPEKAPPFASLPGTYVVDRYTEREVCRIGLTRAALGGSGRYEARLLEGCRDAGLRTFDPLTWHYEGGRLTLTSRRGHEVTLISERPDHWRRDPEVGATLILRKTAP
jgi:Protease inhibitor Inh